MPVHNTDVADIFNRLADLLEIEGANQFRVRAYRNAARAIAGLPRSVAEMVEEGEDLTARPGIGKDLAGKIKEVVETGGLAKLREIERRTPPELAELLRIPGLGPKHVKTLYEEMGITNLAQLEGAVTAGKIRALQGFGRKTEQNILEELHRWSQEERRFLINAAQQIVEPLVDYLETVEGVGKVEVAGSYRRRKQTVGDLDILATAKDGAQVANDFVEYEDVDEIVSHGRTRCSVALRSGIQVDLRVVPQASYGAALVYFTGSKAHGIALRNMALERELKINEYGVFQGEERIAGETEEGIYEVLGLPYIAPELREDQGEIQAAKEGRLPELVNLRDLRGDLQSHTKASDGHASLEEMARAAQLMGYEYLAITDHSPRVAVTGGLDAKRLARQIEQIDRLNEKLDDIVLLKSIEVDILEDGSLDLPDEILQELDLVIGAVHSKFKLPREKQTERIIRAMDNPHFNILAHPTGRQLGKRRPYELDMERLLEAARQRGCFLEVNAQPDRLDLDDVHCRMAKEMGVGVAISTDAHRTGELDFMRFGVGQARRGWLESSDVLNTRSWKDLKKLLNR